MFKSPIRISDIKSILVISLLLIPANFFKLFCKNNWLFSERGTDARDNGYFLYCHNYTKRKIVKRYLISKNSPDLYKFSKNDKVVFKGTFKHYIIYLFSYVHLSAHVNSDSPNFRVTNFLKRHKLLYSKRVFLQHGVIKDNVLFCYKNSCYADLFITSGYKEYDFIVQNFGYEKKVIKLTGLARYDSLISKPINQILIMPTWRHWLKDYSNDDFVNSKYFLTYQSLLQNKVLINELSRTHTKLIFYFHHDMQMFCDLFKFGDNIVIAKEKDFDVQKLLIESKLLITDYSSVAFDFAFMKKPLIYYHFDYDDYSNYQNSKGYFDYSLDGFGKVIYSEDELVNEILDNIKKSYHLDGLYLERTKLFFKYFDNDNCERIYDEVIKIL